LQDPPTPFIDPAFVAQLVKIIVDTKNNVLAPIAQVVSAAPIVTTPTNNVVALVRIMKSIREMIF
jgi:hypothetical protein